MRSSRGVTLIELLVTIMIIAILGSIALPSFRSLIENNQVAAQANGLLSAAQFARSEAVKLGTGVSLTLAADGAWCVHTTNTCTDTGASPTQIRAGTGSASNSVFASATTITFDRRGENTAGDITFRIQPSGCVDDAGRARTLTVTNVGRSAVTVEDCAI